MKHMNIKNSALLVTLLMLTVSCQKDDYQLGELITPSNVTLNYEIAGMDNENPNGDGSGSVTFTASADNAFSYFYNYDDGQDIEVAPDGSATHIFSVPGVNTFDVKVTAVGSGGLTASTTVPVSVFSGFEDEEARQFLTGGSSKTWYWAADQTGHLGLGPNDKKYPGGDHTYAQWYAAVPFEKSATSMYDAEFVFTIDGEGLTFEQINPSGEAFIQGLYSAALGLGDEGSYPFDISGVKNVYFTEAESIATVDGAYRGTSMIISDGGFMGFYAGTSEYEIIQVTDNILKVRLVQTNNTDFAWYHIFTNVKPVE